MKSILKTVVFLKEEQVSKEKYRKEERARRKTNIIKSEQTCVCFGVWVARGHKLRKFSWKISDIRTCVHLDSK